jgi:hypothetical protein
MIEQYYNSIDENNNLKVLIKLSTETNIYLFNKNKKIKSKIKLLKECDNIKKQELKKYSTMLKNLNTNNISVDIKNICDTLQNKINNLDIFINYVNYIENPKKILPKKNINKFIEYYSN